MLRDDVVYRSYSKYSWCRPQNSGTTEHYKAVARCYSVLQISTVVLLVTI